MHSIWAVIVPNIRLESSLGEPFDLSNEGHHAAVEFEVGNLLEPHDQSNGGSVWDWYRIGGRGAGMFLPPEEQKKIEEKQQDVDWHYGCGPEDLRLGNMARVRDVPENFAEKIYGIIYSDRGVSEALSTDFYYQPFYNPNWTGDGSVPSGLWKTDENGEIIRNTDRSPVPSDKYAAFLETRKKEIMQILIDRNDDWVVIVDCHV